MTGSGGPGPENEEFWREFLSNPDSMQAVGRRVFSRIPSNPRCRICAAPFSGAGAPVMRLIGKRPSDANPNYCTTCETFMIRRRGGAEVEGSLLFADIRGSTSIAERIPGSEYRSLLDRFYTAASHAVFDHNGMVDKFVGDELVAIFPPVLNSDRHAANAVETALDVLRRTGHGEPGGPWVPLGAGVHTGRVWFGAIGEGAHVELTVVGDTVNVAARLAALAEPGEVLLSGDAARAAGIEGSHRTVTLKGRQQPIEVVALRLDSAGAA